MNNELKSFKVTIFGNQYTLVSDEPQATILEAAATLDALMQELAGKYTLQNAQTIAILAALKSMSNARELQVTLEQHAIAHTSLIKEIEQSLRLLSDIV